MPKSNIKEAITDEQRKTFVAHEEFEDRVGEQVLHMVKESREYGREVDTLIDEYFVKNEENVEKIIKNYLIKNWLYVTVFVLLSILSTSKVIDMVALFGQKIT
ncbi:MAG: hypothetical protein OYG31_00715 [Candidatus Kaiserbacteria bacterium]|nr:hypothetical protein [Candidatus Kaiserbacteria bacterium]